VALRKITGIEGSLVLVNNCNAEITLGDTYKSAFLEIMNAKLMH
jgi:hypothetical protein